MRDGIAGEDGCLDIEMFSESFDLSENSVWWKEDAWVSGKSRIGPGTGSL